MPPAHLLAPALRPRANLPHLTSALTKLAAEIDAACGRPPAVMKERIVAALAAAVLQPTFLGPDQSVGRADRYIRHVLHGDPAGRFTILALVWNPGQFSPPHTHLTWCGFAVRSGVLTETVYAPDDAAMTARPLREATRHAGYSCFEQAGPDHVHRVGNAGPAPAVSIHVYGVARERVETHVNRLVEVARE
jgi:predicted metal-dependent enzyme (double-stranded beta helix superfamily)